jgi:hypothetical protein
MSMEERRSFVIFDNCLVGIINAPIQPFAWQTFTNSMTNTDWRVVERVAEKYGWMLGRVMGDRVPLTVASAEEIFLLSEDFRILLDRYGIPFTVEVSEGLLRYQVDVPELDSGSEITQQCRIADRLDVFAAGKALALLLVSWFSTNVRETNSYLTQAEVQMMQQVTAAHISKRIDNHMQGFPVAGHDSLQLMKYVLTPEEERIKLLNHFDSAVRERSEVFEGLMVRNNWHHVW